MWLPATWRVTCHCVGLCPQVAVAHNSGRFELVAWCDHCRVDCIHALSHVVEAADSGAGILTPHSRKRTAIVRCAQHTASAGYRDAQALAPAFGVAEFPGDRGDEGRVPWLTLPTFRQTPCRSRTLRDQDPPWFKRVWGNYRFPSHPARAPHHLSGLHRHLFPDPAAARRSGPGLHQPADDPVRVLVRRRQEHGDVALRGRSRQAACRPVSRLHAGLAPG